MKIKRKILNFAILFSVILMGGLCFYNAQISHESVVNKVEKYVSEPIVETPEIEDDEVFEFMLLATNQDFQSIEDKVIEEKIEKEAKAKKINKEDPIKIAKKNQAKKGVAVDTTAKKAVQTYETSGTSLGIDVSTWQGEIDWKKVKEAGINFAMIRVGYRGTVSGKIGQDRYFERNIKEAIANDINVGIYFFSSAINSKEAKEEAEWIYSKIKDYDVTFPVAIDIEVFNEARLKGVSIDQMTENALVFCNYMRSKGYTPMIYSYLSAFNYNFKTEKFANERIWLAQFNERVTYKGRYYMWQYTSNGRVPGINGAVDMDVAYFTVTKDPSKKEEVKGVIEEAEEPKEEATVEEPAGEEQPVIEEEPKVEVEFINVSLDSIVTKEVSISSTIGGSYEGILKVNDKIEVTGLNKEYVRIKINNKIYYVDDVEFYDVVKDIEYSGSNGKSNS